MGMPKRWWILMGISAAAFLVCLVTGFGGAFAYLFLVLTFGLLIASPGANGR